MTRTLIGLMMASLLMPARVDAQVKPSPDTAGEARARAAAQQQTAEQQKAAKEAKAALQRQQQTYERGEAERVRKAMQSKANIRFDISITDEGGGASPVRKAVTLVVADRGYTSSRSQVRLTPDVEKGLNVFDPSKAGLPLNVDVGMNGDLVELQDDGRVRARVNIVYQPYSPELKTLPGSVQGSSKLLFESGKKVVFAQTADAVTDRHTTIEVTATILK